MKTGLYSFLGAIIGALITSYFAILKIKAQYSYKDKIRKHNYLFDKLIKNGISPIYEYCNSCYNILKSNGDKNKTYTAYRELNTPFKYIKRVDCRYKTNWELYISIIHTNFLANTQEGKLIDEITVKVLDLFLEELYFYFDRQEMKLEASVFKITIWNTIARVKFYKKRKKVLSL